MSTDAPHTLIPVRATEQLVDALNQAAELDADPEAKIEFLLQRLQTLLNRPTRCALWLLDDLKRKPAPRIASRTVVRPPFDAGVLGTIEQAQQVLDESAPISQMMVRRVLESIRTPVVHIASGTGATQWFESVLVRRHLAPIGYVDCIAAMWAATPDRAIFVVVHRRDVDPPFNDKDTTMVSLMLRAVAPFVDREIFQRAAPEPHEELSPREREILLMLLAGDSEKQVASRISRSINTVHTFVRQIYRLFNVSSRGELMAQFVDKAVVESLRHTAGA